VKAALQQALIAAYGFAKRSRLLETRVGEAFFTTSYGIYKRIWDQQIDCLSPLVGPGSWVIDVGANIGYHSASFVRWVHAGGKVLAIEPEPRNAALLRRSLRSRSAGGNIDIVEAVAAELDGDLFLKVSTDSHADHRLRDSGGLQVKAHRLDSLIEQQGRPRVSLIKIDVQGAEMRVLAGAMAILERDHPALLIEIDDQALGEQDTSAAALVACVAEAGYRMFDPRDTQGVMPLDPAAAAAARSPSGYADYLFIADR
jgi:FkbM family methyltransferase